MTATLGITTLATGLLDSLSGLSGVSWSDPRAVLGWRSPLPAWAWGAIILAAVLLSLWSYHRLLGNKATRIALALVRGMILLAIVALLAGPMLVVPREKVDPDWLLVLVDVSASMRIKDMPGASKGAPTISREQAVYQAMQAHRDLFGKDKLGKDRTILWLGFDANAHRIADPTDPSTKMDDPVGQATAIRAAIEQALQMAAGHPISAVILLTDGQAGKEDTGAPLVQRLAQQDVPVMAVPLGSMNGGVDITVEQVDASAKAFAKDQVPVMVWIGKYPQDAKVDPTRIHVRLYDKATDALLDEKTLAAGDDLSKPVRLTFSSAVVGQHSLRVQVDYDPRPGEPQELVKDDNSRELTVELTDQPLNVLYVEGYPRWEYRYLKNLLVREKSVRASVMLLSADNAFVQEGAVPIQRLPQTPEEFKPYDVIIIGDVPADYFSQEQLRLIQDQVANQGAGLLWIGGAYETPMSYDATALSGLLPMRHPAAVDRVPMDATPITVERMPAAELLNIMQLHAAPGETDDPTLWPPKLPGLLWAQKLGDLKPATEILATGHETGAEPTAAADPLIVRMHYGAGQSLYVATDDTWRWRYGRGELYFEQFWTQLIRMLGRNRIQQDHNRVRLTASERRANVDDAVILTLHVDDPLVAHRPLDGLKVLISRVDDPTHAVIETKDLLPKPSPSQNSDSASDPDAPRQFEAEWHPQTAGRLLLKLAGPGVEDLDVSQIVEVYRADDELRHPQPDRDRLVKLAADTGGKVVEVNKLEDLSSLVPNRARRTPDDIREPLWNSYLALILVITLLTLEWIGRKIVKLS